MGLTDEHYRRQLEQLLPRGKAWEGDDDSVLRKVLHAIADEFARIGVRVLDLIEEADPRTTDELLEDWERVVGLPDGCSLLAPTVAERRLAVVAKLVGVGDLREQYFIDLAASLGYQVEIKYHLPFRVGDRVGGRIYGMDWMYVFTIVTVSGANDALLECIISRSIPAHTIVLFEYQ